jgi:signal transduction histidine kinase
MVAFREGLGSDTIRFGQDELAIRAFRRLCSHYLEVSMRLFGYGFLPLLLIGPWLWLQLQPSGAVSAEQWAGQLRQHIQPLLADDSDVLSYGLRNLAYAEPVLELAAVWQAQERLFPAGRDMPTWTESSRLGEALPSMNVLRQQLETDTGASLWLRLYLGSGAAWLNCYSLPAGQDVCLLLSEEQLIHDGITLPDPEGDRRLLKNGLVPLIVLFAAWLLAWQLLCQRLLLRHLRQQAAGLLHDLRLPLANIALYLALLKRNGLVSGYLDVLEQESRRTACFADALAEALQQPLFDRRKITPRQDSRVLSAVQVLALLQSRLDCWQPALQQANITLQWQPSASGLPAQLPVNEQVLMRILDNLLDNACRHAAGGQIALWLVPLDQDVQLRWVCAAPAVVPAARGRLVLRWRQGLGLLSCRRLARRQGWQYWQCVEGAVFRLALRFPGLDRCTETTIGTAADTRDDIITEPEVSLV